MTADPTRNYYETHASEYFRITYQTDLSPLWMKLRRNLKPNATILDIGCGSGRDLRHFAQQGFRVVGIDYAFHMLQLAQAFSQQPIDLDNIVHLPFKQHTFDAVWSIGSLLHVHRHVLPAAFAQIHSVLKPDALFFSAMKLGQGEGFDSRGRFTVFYL
ncbi:MAG: class I SAM-dependent methyltransferase, partial [Chloroflexales bacterium]|nr:class I SAM-dependent methyltransferase [Chloroflexales bacterium]